MMARLIHKQVQEINDDMRFCPDCHKQITQHIITNNWKEMSVCDCGWNSSLKIRMGPHQSRFYKIAPSLEKEEYLELIKTLTLK